MSKYLNAGILIAILFYIFVLYSVPLQSNTFYYDDNGSIVDNQAIRTIDIPKIFDAFNTRFLVGLSFALNYKWCTLYAAGYRLINLLIHCFNAFLVYLLIKTTLNLYFRNSIPYSRLKWASFFGPMLFLCHPIQTEPINFITQRFVLMATFFYLLTLFLYIQYRCWRQKKFMFAAMGAAIAAMFCKEFVVTLPVMLALYDFYFLSPRNETIWKRCRRLVPFFIIALIVPMLLLRTPPEAIGVANIADAGSMHHVNITRAWGGVSRKQYFLTELNVVCTYVRLLFVPVNQNLDYDYPLSHGTGRDFLSGLFLLCLLALAAVTYRSYRIVSFAILWFFIALSVESSFIPIGHVIAEYRLYLASVGFVFLITSLIYARQTDLKKLNLIAAAILIGFSILTYQRNKVWKDETTLWADAIQKSPHKARPYYNHGYVYFHQGKLAQAIPDFNEAIKISPDDISVYINRGIIYYEEGNFIQALSDYNNAIKINPKVAEAYYNRGNVYTKQKNLAGALSDYNKAITLSPVYVEAYINRGSIYVMQGNFTQAMDNYNKAIQIYPLVKFSTDLYVWLYGLRSNSVGEAFKSHYASYAEVYYNRGCVYDRQGHLAEAILDYSKAIELNPNYADAYNNRGDIYSRQGRYTQAILEFTKAIAINPNNAGYYYNRGISDSKQDNYVQAIFDFTRAIEINPDYAEAYYNRAVCYYELKEYAQALADAHRAQRSGYTINPEFLSALNKVL